MPSPRSNRALITNFSALASGHALGLVVPLLTVPYLARVLRPEGWAPVLVAQALAGWVMLLLDYGFELSATRAVAHARGNNADIREIVWSVQYAKLLLVPVAVLLLVGAFILVPGVANAGPLMVWTCVLGVVRGLNPLWFFQGLERMRGAVVADSSAKILGAVCVFAVVRAPADGWKVVALQACFSALSCGWLTLRLARTVPATQWSLATAVATLRDSWALFACRASSTLYLQANTILLSIFSTPVAVAAYGGAERIVRASLNLLEPLTRTFLPHVSYLSAADPARAAVLIQRCLAVVGVGSALAGATMSFAAPTLVHLLLGQGYEVAIPVLRWLALLLPIITVATVLSTFWALPYKKDRMLLSATAAAGLANITLAYLFIPTMAALGMAAAVVVAESLVVGTLAVSYVRWRGTAPHESAVPL